MAIGQYSKTREGSLDWMSRKRKVKETPKDLEARVLEELRLRLGEKSDEWKWLRRNVEWDAPDLRKATTEEVLAVFGNGEGGSLSVNDSRLVRTMLWQSWIKIQAEVDDPVDGNIRSYWYQRVEPFYRKHDLLHAKTRERNGRATATAVAQTMTEVVGEFVGNRIFEYGGAFHFEAGMESLVKKGRNFPRILFFTEKEGLKKLADYAYNQVETISYVVSKGQPSFVNLEYFAKRFIGSRVGTMVIGAFCDWDPWGLQIAEQIDAKMRFLGETIGFKVETYMLTSRKLFMEEDIAAAHDLSTEPEHAKVVAHWMAWGGGIDGKPLALHLDVIPFAKKKIVVERFIEAAKGGQLGQYYLRVNPAEVSPTRVLEYRHFT